jgi:hypothetical protein
VYNDDIRRFCLPTTISFSEFITNIGKLFKVDEITVKYVDDEGDAIVVTSDEELQEAFRLAKELNPPILRVAVQAAAAAATSARVAVVSLAPSSPSLATQTIIVEKQTFIPPPSPTLEPSQYPPLDVAFWDAPAKTQVGDRTLPAAQQQQQVTTTTTVVVAAPPALPLEEQRPVRIAQQMADHCISTSRSVSQCSRDTTNDTLKYSDSTRLQLNDSGLVHSTVTLCSDLSRKIAEDCRMLSLQTAEISRRLAAERSAETRGAAKNDINEMTAAVVSFTNRLSAETAQMCRNLSQATSHQTLPL